MVTKKFKSYKKVIKNQNIKNAGLRNILKTKQKKLKPKLKLTSTTKDSSKITLKNIMATNKYSKNRSSKLGKIGKSSKYIKMPEIDTSMIQSIYFLPPLKYIESDKQAIDTEKMVLDQIDFYDKIESKN